MPIRGEYMLLLFWRSAKFKSIYGTFKISYLATLPVSIKLCWFHLTKSQVERQGTWASCLTISSRYSCRSFRHSSKKKKRLTKTEALVVEIPTCIRTYAIPRFPPPPPPNPPPPKKNIPFHCYFALWVDSFCYSVGGIYFKRTNIIVVRGHSFLKVRQKCQILFPNIKVQFRSVIKPAI